MQQVVASQLAPRLLHQLLERRALLREPSLQRPCAEAQLSRDAEDDPLRSPRREPADEAGSAPTTAAGWALISPLMIR
jgi:hypothetical protein